MPEKHLPIPGVFNVIQWPSYGFFQCICHIDNKLITFQDDMYYCRDYSLSFSLPKHCRLYFNVNQFQIRDPLPAKQWSADETIDI